MSSFLDELKSKHEAAIREEQAENSFYEKLLDQKEEILEKLFQCEIKNAVENIKKHFSYFLKRILQPIMKLLSIITQISQENACYLIW